MCRVEINDKAAGCMYKRLSKDSHGDAAFELLLKTCGNNCLCRKRCLGKPCTADCFMHPTQKSSQSVKKGYKKLLKCVPILKCSIPLFINQPVRTCQAFPSSTLPPRSNPTSPNNEARFYIAHTTTVAPCPTPPRAYVRP